MSRGLRWTPEQMSARGWKDPKLTEKTYGKPQSFQTEGDMYESITGHRSKVLDASAAPIQPRQRTRKPKDAATDFPDFCVSHGLPRPLYDYRFHPKRRWRFDAVWPLEKVAVEIDGSVWTQGRHTRGAGFIADQQKLNAAVLAGWRVLRYTPDRLDEAIADLRIILGKS